MKMPRLTEEQRKFISDQFLNKKKSGKQIIEAFKEEFGFMPSASVINKYQYYSETVNEDVEDEVKEDDKGLRIKKRILKKT